MDWVTKQLSGIMSRINSDDNVGNPKTWTVTKAYAEGHTGVKTSPKGFYYDKGFQFSGSGYKFVIYLDVAPN